MRRLRWAFILGVTLGGWACESAEAVPIQTKLDPSRPGAWFVNTGCTACHSVSVYGHQNPAATGPDLSLAVEDVPRRFGRSLDDFVRAPIGTMQLVLTGRIRLTPEEREIAIRKLKDAYQEYVAQRGLRPVASH